jgi:hypothetical protein
MNRSKRGATGKGVMDLLDMLELAESEYNRVELYCGVSQARR